MTFSTPERLYQERSNSTISPAGRQMRHIALEIPLCHFPVAGFLQGHHPANPRVQALGDALDHAAFSCGVAAFENHGDFRTGVLDPVLQLDQFRLQPDQGLEIVTAVDRVGMLAVDRSGAIPATWPARTFPVRNPRPACPPVPLPASRCVLNWSSVSLMQCALLPPFTEGQHKAQNYNEQPASSLLPVRQPGCAGF